MSLNIAVMSVVLQSGVAGVFPLIDKVFFTTLTCRTQWAASFFSAGTRPLPSFWGIKHKIKKLVSVDQTAAEKHTSTAARWDGTDMEPWKKQTLNLNIDGEPISSEVSRWCFDQHRHGHELRQQIRRQEGNTPLCRLSVYLRIKKCFTWFSEVCCIL